MSRPPKSDLPEYLRKILKIVGANIRTLRQQKEMSQAELANQAKISVTTLNEIESKAHRDIRLSTLASIAQVLNVSLIELFVDTDINLSSTDVDQLLQASEVIRRLSKKARK